MIMVHREPVPKLGWRTLANRTNAFLIGEYFVIFLHREVIASAQALRTTRSLLFFGGSPQDFIFLTNLFSVSIARR